MAVYSIIASTLAFWNAFALYACGSSLDSRPRLLGGDRFAQLWVYSLAHTLRLWSQPHYRSRSFAADLQANLRNVAVPGTGIALSVFASSRAAFALAVLLLNPLACLVAAWLQQRRGHGGLAAAYHALLCSPSGVWFATWRINSWLAAWHAHVTSDPSYSMEEKGAFLLAASNLALPVSPFLRCAALFVKHRRIEGGIAIHKFANFTAGGDWIIQAALENSEPIARLLPRDAPLSTVRVVTASLIWLERRGVLGCPRPGFLSSCTSPDAPRQRSRLAASTPPLPLSARVPPGLAEAGSPPQPLPAADSDDDGVAAPQAGRVEVVTAVWRGGRAGRATDHEAVNFAVDPDDGLLGPGCTAAHWYRLGVCELGRVARPGAFERHPDSGVPVTGQHIPGFDRVLATCLEAHALLAPCCPFVGHDMALTPDGPVLLEINLSCNLFNGAYDVCGYSNFCAELVCELEALEREAGSSSQQRRCKAH